MNPTLALRAHLSRPARNATGTIVERIEAGRYRVSVSGALVEALASASVAFALGDTVALRDGVIIGRVRNPATIKSYSV